MKSFTLLDLIRQAIIASIYVVLVLVFQWISFKEIQFRVAEILLLLIFFDKKSFVGLTLGVFVANLFSPFLLYDLSFGVLATLLTLSFMLIFRKRPYIALIFPSIINGLVIGLMLFLAIDTPFLIAFLWVFLGEFTITYIFGLPIYYLLKRANFENIYFTER